MFNTRCRYVRKVGETKIISQDLTSSQHEKSQFFHMIPFVTLVFIITTLSCWVLGVFICETGRFCLSDSECPFGNQCKATHDQNMYSTKCVPFDDLALNNSCSLSFQSCESRNYFLFELTSYVNPSLQINPAALATAMVTSVAVHCFLQIARTRKISCLSYH